MSQTKRLFILRHAKSSWDDPGLDDHERPLAPRGRRACKVMADHLRTSAIEPQLVLCSSSRRTRETLEGIAPAGEHVIESELYSASTADLVERLRRVPDDVGSVMLIGHNPAVQMLALRLARRDGDAGERVALARKFPTGALATLTFECSWSELAPGSGRLAAFLTPKELNPKPGAGAGAPGPPA
ncbi:MAG TPA: histidine phosphatase family protein [Solirubrobacteraceae bacterium]|nr:histidine phosphatase family protein [Solirubrobacteraceae bacterium]